MTAELTRRSRLSAVLEHPLGRDVIESLTHRVGVPLRLIDNPVVRSVRLSSLPTLTRGRIDDAFVDALVTLLNSVPDRAADHPLPARKAWFKEAVFYQIYPRSFQDSNGDGIGDLRGIISRLDYVKELGVDALWLSPIYDSPGDDNGYDVRDYRAILAEFGTMSDFDELVAGLRSRGMKLVMDLVVNHTSDEHAWFQHVLANADSPYRDYYFLRPGDEHTPSAAGAPNNTTTTPTSPSQPPNNWQSFFSGSAWRWFDDEQLWGLHLFSSKQMDLNWQNPDMRAEVYDMVRWWRERGVDGFRLDVINLISKAPGLPQGNPTIGKLTEFTGLEHYFHGPHLHDYLRELRAEAMNDPDCVAIGETPALGVQAGKLLVGEDRGELDMVFNFDQLEAPGKTRFDDYRYDLKHLRDYYEKWQAEFGDGYWMSLFLDNHDNPRFVSKVDRRPEHREAIAKLLATVQFTLRGTPFLYQGQEIGMVDQAFTSLDQLRDVESLNLAKELASRGVSAEAAWAQVLAGTRDHTRVPMPWNAMGGFTTGTPWIEGDGSHAQVNVAAQQGDPSSVLEWHRALITLRRENPTLIYGETVPCRRRRSVWGYRRVDADGEFLVELNLTDRSQRSFAPTGYVLELASSIDISEHQGTSVPAPPNLAPYEARIWCRS